MPGGASALPAHWNWCCATALIFGVNAAIALSFSDQPCRGGARCAHRLHHSVAHQGLVFDIQTCMRANCCLPCFMYTAPVLRCQATSERIERMQAAPGWNHRRQRLCKLIRACFCQPKLAKEEALKLCARCKRVHNSHHGNGSLAGAVFRGARARLPALSCVT